MGVHFLHDTPMAMHNKFIILSPALNLHWLVLRIGGTDFLHCWATDSIRLECAESLISNSFHGTLFRMSANFRVVLHVIRNSLVHRVWSASS